MTRMTNEKWRLGILETWEGGHCETLQARDGRNVRIYALDGGGSHPIIGCIASATDDGWVEERWMPDGHLEATEDRNGDVIPRARMIRRWLVFFGPDGSEVKSCDSALSAAEVRNTTTGVIAIVPVQFPEPQADGS